MIPVYIPECAERLLARSAWFSDPQVFQRARLAPANRLARLIGSPTFAKRSDIAATTLGRNIYFQAARHFDPHSPGGLSLLAHEFKHVEQIGRKGLFRFYLQYLLDYLRSGYGENMPQEAEAYELGRVVYAHIRAEMLANPGIPMCLGKDGAHRPNPEFVLIAPAPFYAGQL